MKRFVFIVILFISHCVNAQIKSYIYKLNKTRLNVVMYIDTDKQKFKEVFSINLNDIFSSYIISEGYYTHNKDTLILKDTVIGFTQKIKLKDSLMIPISSLIINKEQILVQNKNVYPEKELNDNLNSLYKSKNINGTKKERNNIYGNYTYNFKQKRGNLKNLFLYKLKHESDSGLFNFNLLIAKNGNYIYKAYDIIISEGKWEYKNKKILLYDTKLNYIFVGAFKRKKLYNLILPLLIYLN